MDVSEDDRGKFRTLLYKCIQMARMPEASLEKVGELENAIFERTRGQYAEYVGLVASRINMVTRPTLGYDLNVTADQVRTNRIETLERIHDHYKQFSEATAPQSQPTRPDTRPPHPGAAVSTSGVTARSRPGRIQRMPTSAFPTSSVASMNPAAAAQAQVQAHAVAASAYSVAHSAAAHIHSSLPQSTPYSPTPAGIHVSSTPPSVNTPRSPAVMSTPPTTTPSPQQPQPAVVAPPRRPFDDFLAHLKLMTPEQMAAYDAALSRALPPWSLASIHSPPRQNRPL